MHGWFGTTQQRFAIAGKMAGCSSHLASSQDYYDRKRRQWDTAPYEQSKPMGAFRTGTDKPMAEGLRSVSANGTASAERTAAVKMPES